MKLGKLVYCFIGVYEHKCMFIQMQHGFKIIKN